MIESADRFLCSNYDVTFYLVWKTFILEPWKQITSLDSWSFLVQPKRNISASLYNYVIKHLRLIMVCVFSKKFGTSELENLCIYVATVLSRRRQMGLSEVLKVYLKSEIQNNDHRFSFILDGTRKSFWSNSVPKCIRILNLTSDCPIFWAGCIVVLRLRWRSYLKMYQKLLY